MLLPSLLLLCAQNPAIDFIERPTNGQLFPRDSQNQAEVSVSGRVHELGWDEILVVTFRDETVFDVYQQDLSYTAIGAFFETDVTIQAELNSYSFRVMLRNAGGYKQVAQILDVVAGDALLIQGQSNAVASDSHGQGLANQEQSPWIRSFGNGTLNAGLAGSDINWYTADGEGAADKGTIGAWGLRMSNDLVQATGIPLAILNGAIGATPISWHLRSDGNPTNLASNYGRLLTRARNAGLADSVRAIIWYQGEADGNRALHYATAFPKLHSAWLEDYPALEKVYLFQVRNGCGAPSSSLREVQRRLKDYLPITEIMSTSGAPAHDGCHYFYGGYRNLGDRIARQVGRDLYASTDTHEIDPPNLAFAQFTSPAHDAILLTFRDLDDSLVFEPGAEVDFLLGDGVQVIAGAVSGNTVLLTLGSPSTSPNIIYLGHPKDGAWMMNGRGIGALAFNVKILP